MISDRTLDRAVADGLLSAAQADRLRSLETVTPPPIPTPEDPEQLRFVSGFGDIFVALGIGLFLGPVAYFTGSYGGPFVRGLALAALSWLLAEFFTRRRRMALPSIILLCVFVAAGFAALMQLFGLFTADVPPPWYHPKQTGPWFLPDLDSAAVALAALGSVGLAILHYWRFRVPITVAAGAAALCVAITAAANLLIADFPPLATEGLLLVCGVLVFLVAMRFDMSDPARATRRTDIAFWLHLLAAPLIVHSLLRGFMGGVAPPDPRHAIGVLGVFLVLGIIAVVIDRRALLVSGLVYAGIAFSTLIRQTELGGTLVPATVLALGVFVLALSAGWRPLRRAFLRCLPAALARRLPHPLVVSV